ncbi:ATP-grasp domain-containing protein [Streptomyces sp. STR69]|uniref:ATP-grasp domain-containing protein n=1 Tax=Streptomyces sp. STR69 TaxID=1796942 RepID=UPI0021C76B40|nr:ATP-grasp domain-containing protein [Streptomyces sp. STR69]
MSTKKRVCVIAAREPLLRRAAALGLEVLSVQTPQEFRSLPADLTDAVTTLVLDYHDRDLLVETVRALHAARPLDGVFTVYEESLLPAAHLADALGLPGPSYETVKLLTDKWAMREHLRKAGVGTVAAALGRGEGDLAAFGAEHGYPFIAKPVAGSASLGIFRLDSADEVPSVAERLREVGLDLFLMEEFLDGHEISVDGISFHGRYVMLAVCDKITGPHFIELGHSLPAALDAEQLRSVEELVASFLDCVGLADGLSHVEVKLTGAGPKIVEGHNRRGGDRLNTLADAVYGIDLEELGLAWAAGAAEELPASPEARCGTAVCFFTAERGLVREVLGAEEVRAHPQVLELHVNFPVGSSVPRLRWSLDRAGYVVVRAGTAGEALALGRDLASRIRLVVDEVAPDLAADDASHRDLIGELDQAARLGYRTS